MEYLKAVILGIIQGLTEFLPISSSGHLSVAQHFMGLSGSGSLMLTVFLHIGTLVAVILVYYKTFWKLIKEIGFFFRDLFTGKLSRKNETEDRHLLYMMVLSCIPLLFLFIPIGGGRNIKDLADQWSGDNDIILEGVCFFVTAVLLFAGSYASRHKKNIRPRAEAKDAWWVGFAQFLAAVFPGLSRSGSTIATGMLCGVEKNYMVEYSFVLGTPAVLAASIVEIKDALGGATTSLSVGPILVGILTAGVFGVLAIKLLEWLVKKDKFQFFGYYCLVLSIVVIALGVWERVSVIQ